MLTLLAVVGIGCSGNPQTGKIEIKRAWTATMGPDSMIPTLQDWKDFLADQEESND